MGKSSMIMVDWTQFKAFFTDRAVNIYYIDFGDYYLIKASDDFFEIFCEISKTPTDGADLLDFEGNYKAGANKKLRSSEFNAPSVHVIKSTESSFKLVSHWWNDPTTWYEESVRVTGESLTTSDNLTYSSVNTNWIDLVSGKIYQEDTISTPYLVKIYADGVLQTTGFTINYPAGTITFTASQAGKAITADYSYENGSLFTFKPDAGKILMIEHTEVQFSTDTKIPNVIHGDANTSGFDFDIYAYNPYDLPNKVAVKQTKYKSEVDIINDANQGQGWIPHFGNLPGTSDILVFPFEYGTLQPLRDSQGLELRVSLKDNVPLLGSFSTLTIYCMSRSE